jgi:membrane protease YdiL (CAAX protease family)
MPPPPTTPSSNDPLQPRPFLAEPGDPDDTARPGPPRDPGTPFSRTLAVVATFLLVVAVVGLQFAGRHASFEPPSAELPPPDIQMLLIGRMAVGVEAIGDAAGPGSERSVDANAEQLLSQLDGLSKTAIRDQVRTAIISGELEGKDTANARLDDAAEALTSLRADLDEQPDDERKAVELERIENLNKDIAALRLIYNAANADAANLSTDTRDRLIEQHGYFGKVALAYGLDDADPARAAVRSAGTRTVITLITAFAIGSLAFLAGIVLFILMVIKLFSRKGIMRAYSPPAFGGSVYLETFVLFLGGFVVISLLGGVLNNATGLTLDYIIIWLLLLVPFWPLLRGQSWANHKHALGWTSGKGFIREIFAGVVGYLALLPIFIVGVLFTLLLTILFAFVERIIAPDAPSEPLTHPIMEQLAGGDFKTLLLLLSLAALWAPLVEETIFRGALYHHVRAKWRAAMSGLFVGFVFAVIHPQGFAAIPALMSLGFSFALLREWRGSLIAPITAHAMHNGFLVTMLWLALS